MIRLTLPVRSWCASAALVGLALAVPLAAKAEAGQPPDAMILSLSSEVLESIRADKAIRAGDFGRLQKLVNERIVPHVDFDKMTRLAVGRPWRGASPDQRHALIEQFQMLLLRTYAGALSRVTDEKVRLRPSRGLDTPTDAVVRTEIYGSQGDPITLDYRLEKTDSVWLIYDMNILGIWLVENYKTEFASALNQGGIEGLIKTLTDKNASLARSAKPS